jgi:hypothetical protein
VSRITPSPSPTPSATATVVLRATALLGYVEGSLQWVPPCLTVKLLRGEGVVVWPPNFVVSFESNGIHVVDKGMVTGLQKEVDIHFGDHVLFGGGVLNDVPLSYFQTSQRNSCPGPYFVINTIDYSEIQTATPIIH